MKTETSPTYLVNTSKPEEELKYVDPDIAESCRLLGPYVVGLPTQMQLCRNLRELCVLIKEAQNEDEL